MEGSAGARMRRHGSVSIQVSLREGRGAKVRSVRPRVRPGRSASPAEMSRGVAGRRRSEGPVPDRKAPSADAVAGGEALGAQRRGIAVHGVVGVSVLVAISTLGDVAPPGLADGRAARESAVAASFEEVLALERRPVRLDATARFGRRREEVGQERDRLATLFADPVQPQQPQHDVTIVECATATVKPAGLQQEVPGFGTSKQAAFQSTSSTLQAQDSWENAGCSASQNGQSKAALWAITRSVPTSMSVTASGRSLGRRPCPA